MVSLIISTTCCRGKGEGGLRVAVLFPVIHLLGSSCSLTGCGGLYSLSRGCYTECLAGGRHTILISLISTCDRIDGCGRVGMGTSDLVSCFRCALGGGKVIIGPIPVVVRSRAIKCSCPPSCRCVSVSLRGVLGGCVIRVRPTRYGRTVMSLFGCCYGRQFCSSGGLRCFGSCALRRILGRSGIRGD